jgi:hypothetical protein
MGERTPETTLTRSDLLGTSLLAALVPVPGPAGAQAQARLAEEQVMRIAVGVDDIRTVDPHISIGIGEQPIVGPVHEALLLFPDGLITGEGLRPGLAERCESSPDRKIWTFHLRRGVEWHHGHGPFTADDVVFSIARVRDQRPGSPFRNSLAEVETARTLDPYRVEITLRHPDANFPGLMVDYQAGPLIIMATLPIAGAIREEASLSFLGLGIQPPAPSWGNLIRDGVANVLEAPLLAVLPGAALTLAVLAFNMVGDSLRDLLDPRDLAGGDSKRG